MHLKLRIFEAEPVMVNTGRCFNCAVLVGLVLFVKVY